MFLKYGVFFFSIIFLSEDWTLSKDMKGRTVSISIYLFPLRTSQFAFSFLTDRELQCMFFEVWCVLLYYISSKDWTLSKDMKEKE